MNTLLHILEYAAVAAFSYVALLALASYTQGRKS